MLAWRRLHNAIDYPLRQLVHWRRGGFPWRNQTKRDLFAHLGPAARQTAEAQAARLLTTYPLDFLRTHSTARNFRENLFYLEVLDRWVYQTTEDGGRKTGESTFSVVHPPSSVAQLPGCVVDIGPSDWFYAHALTAFWRRTLGESVTLIGYEADAYRVYNDLRSRHDHARAHMRGLEEARVRYVPAPFSCQPGAFAAVTMFFPFVFARDHLEWGLPGRMFAPERLLVAAWDSVAPGGALLIVNQGEAEHNTQRDLLDLNGIVPAAAGRHDSLLFSYDLPRYVLVAVKRDGRRGTEVGR
jgi:hypothetical protein